MICSVVDGWRQTSGAYATKYSVISFDGDVVTFVLANPNRMNTRFGLFDEKSGFRILNLAVNRTPDEVKELFFSHSIPLVSELTVHSEVVASIYAV